MELNYAVYSIRFSSRWHCLGKPDYGNYWGICKVVVKGQMAASSIYIGCSEANDLIYSKREKCFHHIYLEKNLNFKKKLQAFC